MSAGNPGISGLGAGRNLLGPLPLLPLSLFIILAMLIWPRLFHPIQ